MSRVLIYSQDPGGANILARVAAELAGRKDVPSLLTVVHPLSEPVFARLGVRSEPISRWLPSLPADADAIDRWLRAADVSRVICTVSARERDVTNSRLIERARAMGVPTLGFLDHWVGIDRFLDGQGAPAYLPDYVGCIDEASRDDVLAVGGAAARVAIVGHPHLEAVRASATPRAYRPGEPIRLVLVSQPSMRQRSYRGLFFEPVGGRPFFEAFVEAIDTIAPAAPPLEISCRPHPKEVSAEPLPERVMLDATLRADAILDRYDVFVGATSIVLLEAAVARRYTIRLAFPEWADAAPDLRINPSGEQAIVSVDELPRALTNVIDRVTRGDAAANLCGSYLTDALSRATTFAAAFLDDGA